MAESSEEELNKRLVRLIKRLIYRVENAETTEDLEFKNNAYTNLIKYINQFPHDENLKKLVEKYHDAYQKKMQELKKENEKEEKAEQLAKKQHKKPLSQFYQQVHSIHPAEKYVKSPEGFPPNPDETLKKIKKMKTIRELETELNNQISYRDKFYAWVDTILDDVKSADIKEEYEKIYNTNIENIKMEIARLQTEEEGRYNLAKDAAKLAKLQAARNEEELAWLRKQGQNNQLALESARKKKIKEQEAAVNNQINMINSGAIPMPPVLGKEHDSVRDLNLSLSSDVDDEPDIKKEKRWPKFRYKKLRRKLKRRAGEAARFLAEKYRGLKKLKPADSLENFRDEGGFRSAWKRWRRDFNTRGHKGGAGGKTRRRRKPVRKTRRRHKPVRKTRRRHGPIRKTRHRRKPMRKTRHRRKPIRKTRRSRR